jgi:hypothetical protein
MNEKGPESRGIRPADRTFALPDRDEMAQLLGSVETSEVFAEVLHPILLRAHSQEVTGAMLTQRIAEAIDEVTGEELVLVQQLMLNGMPKYLEALITDKEISEDSILLWNEEIEKLKRQDRTEDYAPKTPRKLKKALSKPEHKRTPGEKARVNSFYRGLGRRGL